MVDHPSKISISLEQWHKGDENALNELLIQHLPWLQKRIKRRMGPALKKMGETQDYLQDVVVQFLRHSPKFIYSSEAGFRALLLRIAENVLNNKYAWFTAQRRNIAKQRPLGSDSILHLDPPKGKVRTPSMSADRLEREAWVRFAMELIDPKNHELLVLHQWEKLPFTKIGERLGITQEAARMRYNRAALQLAETIWAIRQGKLEQILGDIKENDRSKPY